MSNYSSNNIFQLSIISLFVPTFEAQNYYIIRIKEEIFKYIQQTDSFPFNLYSHFTKLKGAYLINDWTKTTVEDVFYLIRNNFIAPSSYMYNVIHNSKDAINVTRSSWKRIFIESSPRRLLQFLICRRTNSYLSASHIVSFRVVHVSSILMILFLIHPYDAICAHVPRG